MVEKIKDDLYKLDNTTYLKKFKKNWGIIFPLKDPVTNQVIKKNLFRTKFSTIIFIALILFLCYGYYRDTTYCREIVGNPCIMNEYERCKTIEDFSGYHSINLERGDLIEKDRDIPTDLSSYAKAP